MCSSDLWNDMTPLRTGRDTTPFACRAPVNLIVDHLSSPIGVAVPRPVLAWQVPGPAPARAYEIEVRRLDPAGAAAPEPAWANHGWHQKPLSAREKQNVPAKNDITTFPIP